ncbi:hypothetical protein SteCoe_1005 [Stentor coeruleus]|uniref:Uncharacterized protein n=1 Tax=Stentor coeruleus TaxID=5963 RepID=A0A1R2D2U6_9CILI|nr:hypothetical protein SteCoe_1005 [Stentor coeruleus]
MDVFGNKVSPDLYLDLTVFIALQNSFEEFYKNIQKNPQNISDIPADSIDTYFQKIIFKNNINTCEIAFPMVDFLTAIRMYQGLFNTNYMNLDVIEIENDMTKSLFTTNDLKKLLKDTSWPEIICFTISTSFNLNFLNIFGPVLEQSNEARWVLKSIIAVRGTLYLSIVRKGELWTMDLPTKGKTNNITLLEATTKALEAGFMPIGLFYFYHTKEVPKSEPIISKDINKYIKYKQKAEQIVVSKSMCWNQKRIEMKILEKMKNGDENDIRRLKIYLNPKTYDKMNSVLGEQSQEKPVMKAGNFEVSRQKVASGPPNLRLSSNTKENPTQAGKPKMPPPMNITGKNEENFVSKPPQLVIKSFSPDSTDQKGHAFKEPPNLCLPNPRDIQNNPNIPPPFNAKKMDNFGYQTTPPVLQNTINQSMPPLFQAPPSFPKFNQESPSFPAPNQNKPLSFPAPNQNKPPSFPISNQEPPSFPAPNQNKPPSFPAPNQNKPSSFPTSNQESPSFPTPPSFPAPDQNKPPSFPTSNQEPPSFPTPPSFPAPNQNKPPSFPTSNQEPPSFPTPPSFPAPNQNKPPSFPISNQEPPSFPAPNQNMPPLFSMPNQKPPQTLPIPYQETPPLPNIDIPESFSKPNQSIPPALPIPNQDLPPPLPTIDIPENKYENSLPPNIELPPPLSSIQKPPEISNYPNIIHNENYPPQEHKIDEYQRYENNQEYDYNYQNYGREGHNPEYNYYQNYDAEGHQNYGDEEHQNYIAEGHQNYGDEEHQNYAAEGHQNYGDEEHQNYAAEGYQNYGDEEHQNYAAEGYNPQVYYDENNEPHYYNYSDKNQMVIEGNQAGYYDENKEYNRENPL